MCVCVWNAYNKIAKLQWLKKHKNTCFKKPWAEWSKNKIVCYNFNNEVVATQVNNKNIKKCYNIFFYILLEFIYILEHYKPLQTPFQISFAFHDFF